MLEQIGQRMSQVPNKETSISFENGNEATHLLDE